MSYKVQTILLIIFIQAGAGFSLPPKPSSNSLKKHLKVGLQLENELDMSIEYKEDSAYFSFYHSTGNSVTAASSILPELRSLKLKATEENAILLGVSQYFEGSKKFRFNKTFLDRVYRLELQGRDQLEFSLRDGRAYFLKPNHLALIGVAIPIVTISVFLNLKSVLYANFYNFLKPEPQVLVDGNIVERYERDATVSNIEWLRLNEPSDDPLFVSELEPESWVLNLFIDKDTKWQQKKVIEFSTPEKAKKVQAKLNNLFSLGYIPTGLATIDVEVMGGQKTRKILIAVRMKPHSLNKSNSSGKEVWIDNNGELVLTNDEFFLKNFKSGIKNR